MRGPLNRGPLRIPMVIIHSLDYVYYVYTYIYAYVCVYIYIYIYNIGNT